jgi:hypothetical protein
MKDGQFLTQRYGTHLGQPLSGVRDPADMAYFKEIEEGNALQSLDLFQLPAIKVVKAPTRMVQFKLKASRNNLVDDRALFREWGCRTWH